MRDLPYRVRDLPTRHLRYSIICYMRERPALFEPAILLVHLVDEDFVALVLSIDACLERFV